MQHAVNARKANGDRLHSRFSGIIKYIIPLLLLFSMAGLAAADINTPSPLVTGQLNVSYSKQVTATGGTLFVSTVVDGEYGDWGAGSGYRWSVSAGSLPPGVSLLSTNPNGSGVFEWYDQGNNYYTERLPANAWLYGIPTQGGTYTFTLKALCYGGAYYEKQFTLAVTAQTLSITTTSLPAGEQYVAYSAAVNKQGGISPYTWSIASGSLPAGLSLNSSTGQISGTPTGSGISNFTVQVTSSDSQSATKALSINIVSPCTITTAGLLPAGQLSTIYNVQVNATGGTLFVSTVVDGEYGDYPGGNGYRWSVLSGSLPAGVTLQSTTGSVDEWYDQGNVHYYNAPLPAQAKLYGTPTQSGLYNFTLKALCYGGAYATKDFSIAISIPQLVITTNSLPQNTEGRPYNSTLSATGGITPYSWSIVNGTLQDGLALNASTGAITGTPTTNGTANLTFQVISLDSQTVTKTLSLVIAPPCSVTGTSPLTQARQGVAYNNVISATGGTLYDSMIVWGQYPDSSGGSGYRWSVVSGALPQGISLLSTNQASEPYDFWYDQGNNDYYNTELPGQAVLAGTPPATGTYYFTLKAEDYFGSYSTMDLVLVVNYDFNINEQTVPYGRKDVNYSTQLTADGAPVTYTWSIASGSLPPGLTLTMNGNIGVITGTPTTIGNYTFTVQVAGTNPELNPVATKAFTMEIRDTWDALTGGDHKGSDWEFTSDATIGGEHYGISNFTVAQGITVTMQTGSGMIISAYNVNILGILKTTSDGILELRSENDINLGSEGKIIATKQSDSGPGAGADSQTFDVGANGGSYGGRGGLGAGNTSPRSEPYGTQYGSDIDTGSKGGNTPVSEIIDPIGGMGGKAVLYAGQNVTIDGEVDVSGEGGENGYVDGYQEPSGGAGGGSGGGLLINAHNVILTDNAKLYAYGGSGGHPAAGNMNGGGGGSGGRIKVVCATHNISANAIVSVHGGYAGNENAQSGEDGTFAIVTPPINGSIFINYGAQYATERHVKLSISAVDNNGGVLVMRVKNDNNEWPEWGVGYTSNADWLLTENDGLKTVSVQFQNSAGLISEIYSDTITLDSAPHEFPVTDPEADHPVITVTSPLENTTGHNYTIGDIISVSYNATDNASGIVFESATVNGFSVPNNAQIDATHLEIGENTLVIKAVNGVGLITEKAVKFNIKISIDAVIQMVDRYHTNSHIFDQSVYESLNAQLVAIETSLNQGQSQTAIDQMTALVDYLYTQINTTISVQCCQLIKFYTEHLQFRASIPTNLDLNLSDEIGSNAVHLTLPSGSKTGFELIGSLTVQLTPTNNPDIASMTILHSEYAGTNLIVDGIDYGSLYFTNDVEHPSTGTLDLVTGKIVITENVIVKNAYLHTLGITSIPLSVPQTGSFLPVTDRGTASTRFSLTVPSNVPVLANATTDDGHCGCPSQPKKPVVKDECPRNPRSTTENKKYYPNDGKDWDIDNDDFVDTLDTVYTPTGSCNPSGKNRIEVWRTAHTWRVRWATWNPSTSSYTYGWIGACRYDPGWNDKAIWFTDPDTGDVIFIWRNWSPPLVETDKTGKPTGRIIIVVDIYISNLTRGTLLVVRFRFDFASYPNYQYNKPETHPEIPEEGGELKYGNSDGTGKPIPTNLSEIDPPVLAPFALLFKESLFAETTVPSTWTYSLSLTGNRMKPGDSLKIKGVGITSASVSGEAASDAFGAWRVKEITDSYVIFEVTREVFVNSSFTGFSIIAPNTIKGLTKWVVMGETFGDSGSVSGPIATKIE